MKVHWGYRLPTFTKKSQFSEVFLCTDTIGEMSGDALLVKFDHIN